MRYLFIDTSTHDLTMSIATEEKVLSKATSNNINEHSKYALVELKKAFAIAGLKPDGIDKIIVVTGPGSFTGVRIGVTIAKTYSWSLKKNVIPASSLLVNILGYKGYDYYISVLDARRGYVYAAIYNDQYEEILAEQHISIEKLHEFIEDLKGHIIIIGDIAIEGYDLNPVKIDVLDIINHYKNGQTVNPHSLNPRYLKRVEAEEKLQEMNK